MKNKFHKAKDYFKQLGKIDSICPDMWDEQTIFLVHGEPDEDLTGEAFRIADEAARNGNKVLYVDASEYLYDELLQTADDNLMMFRPEFESIDDKRDYAQIVFDAIEEAVRTTDIRVFVIDSISRIASLSLGRNASVAYLMKRLAIMLRRFRISILVVAEEMRESMLKKIQPYFAAQSLIQSGCPDDEESEAASVGTEHKFAINMSEINRKFGQFPEGQDRLIGRFTLHGGRCGSEQRE